MGRWEPDAAGRLRRAALELFSERGYEATTVADIAERAGVTARTFFRHYADKREVLFAGSQILTDTMLAALADASASAGPLEAVEAAVLASAEVLTDRTFSVQRQRLLWANDELRERELIKLESISAALTEGLCARGVDDPLARIAAETGIAVFRVGFHRWVTGDEPDLREILRDGMRQLRELSAPPS